MVFVLNATIKTVNSAEELKNIYLLGESFRHITSHKLNSNSSRSHMIFTILIESYNKSTNQRCIGKLNLVDLAGSEKVKKSGVINEKLALQEARSINKSLSALGDVISALSQGDPYIPYRNNLLTKLMRDSLGGTAKTLMIVNISPSMFNSEETITSLFYA